MNEQKLIGDVRRALDDYQMIRDGDRVCVGLSGGKDSLALLYALIRLRDFYPHPFSLCACTVDLGFADGPLPCQTDRLAAFCEKYGVLFRKVDTQIASIVFEARKEPRPCSLCSTLRKGALVQAAADMGCQRIALAHHKDDFAETAMMSLFNEGRFYCFPPVTAFEDRSMTVIRPLMYVAESSVRTFVRNMDLPVIPNACPMDGRSQRQEFKELIRELSRDRRGLRDRIFHAVLHGNLDDWPDLKPVRGRKTPNKPF